MPPETVGAGLFDAVLDVANTGRFLPFDKDRRWTSTKDERVLVNDIVHTAAETIVPALSTRGGGLVKVYYYSASEPDISALLRLGERLAKSHSAGVGSRVIWFSDRPDGARGRVMVKRFSAADERSARGVRPLTDCPAADTFGAFADEIGPEGFQFLYQRMKAGQRDGPTLVTVADDRIVGAVGPLTTVAGPDGRVIQQPAYFAVHPAYQGRGHGRSIWRASMAWGRARGAEVKVLQASRGRAAEGLYVSEGLETHGYVCQV
ncbi:GNAT family N-acetyltransferase [Actinomadura bangladeshensis]|uniref:GNAT family N-acetyltransferase n=1 Tax=Actinomadura bangladeshensis TaxID=453573 RepID=A0A6L9Q9Y7_9ACTN|nr:GNAT family N-acetyltransferase [Actinomadura bangladeshensis]NEA22221.1 GNAT family N-acetyltransferase [Actinomadura bangladeshensis]